MTSNFLKMKRGDWLKLIISIVFVQLAGIIGSFFTAPAIPAWYNNLIKPSIAPPSWVFAPVWTTLFLLMGISFFLIWKMGLNKKEVRIALIVFIIQLSLNVLWSVIFFGYRNPGLAFIEIIFLWIAIVINIFVFYRLSKLSAWLLIPYLLWVSFASYLNFSFWQVNRVDVVDEQIFCTMDAKLCPDGSFVGRVPPDCEFSPCPVVD